jgi:hypothetical protein
MQQSFPLEAYGRSASQEIAVFHVTPKFSAMYTNPTIRPYRNRMNPVRISYFFKILFDITTSFFLTGLTE